MKKIAQGAEARIYQDGDVIVKERFRKTYRLPELDDKLRKARTRREAKILKELPIEGPKVIKVDEKSMKIEMSLLPGSKVRDILESSDYRAICTQIGEKVAILHNNNIIHGDLTTSNMMYHEGVVSFLDLGLSFTSHKVEDKAVDLHLLKEALESKHYTIYEAAFAAVLKGYKKTVEHSKEILERLEIVECRGRNKVAG